MHSIIVILAMLPVMAFPIRSAQKDSGELAAVLDRAAQYVTRYLDDELGNVGAAETYRQVSVTFSPNKIRNEEERRICRRVETNTGSRVPFRTLCLTERQWEDYRGRH